MGVVTTVSLGLKPPCPFLAVGEGDGEAEGEADGEAEGEADGETEGRLRVSFTGGEGPHRADRLICDYLRMCRYAGTAHRIHVFTEDADFRRAAAALGGTVHAIRELLSAG